MKTIDLRYQVTIFGNFDDVTPTSENLKFFIDEFYDKNLIPNQFTEVSVELRNKETKNIESTRLRLSDMENRSDIRFLSDKLVITFLNSNIGVVKMITKEQFLKEINNILLSLDKKFSKTYKRIGFVTQYLTSGFENLKTINAFSKIPTFFDTKPIVDWSNSLATRMKIEEKNLYDEIVNASYDLKMVSQIMKIENKIANFNGAILNIDINTIDENQNYRLKKEIIENILNKFLEIEDNVKNQIFEKFVNNN